MNGSASAPSSATRNGTRCAISPEMKATSRDSRSSLATMTGQRGLARRVQRRPELRPAEQRIAALAALGLDVLGEDGDALCLGEPGDRHPLRLDAEPGAPLGARRDAVVGDRPVHVAGHRGSRTDCKPHGVIAAGALPIAPESVRLASSTMIRGENDDEEVCRA